MAALLVFIIATLECLPENKCWTQKGPFGDNVFKNLARYVIIKSHNGTIMALGNNTI